MVQCKNGQERFSPLLPARCFYLLCGCAGSYFGSSSLRRCGFRRSSFAGCGICAAGHAALNDQLILIVKALGEENFFHKDYEETLVDTYGLDYEDELVVEGGVTGGADAASSEAASSEAASSEAAASEVASSAAAQ
jgi:polar amino acid transport system substrate-binding protein